MDTVNRIYRELGERLKEAGVESPLFASEWILRSALGWDRTQFYMNLDCPVPPSVHRQAETWATAHSRGVPIQYLTGEQMFFGRSFSVDPSVLIPRPETEELVEQLLKIADVIWGRQPLQAADLGCGSGAIGVTLAAERPYWHVMAIDLSADAIAMTRRNARRHGVQDRMELFQGDWLAPLITEKKKVDILVSNPPYIPTQTIPELMARVKEHEPHLALDGGSDGLDPYRRIAAQLKQVLQVPALVALEIGTGQGTDVVSILKQRWTPKADTRILLDLAGHERIVLASNEKLPDSL